MLDPANTMILATSALLATAMLMAGSLKGLYAWIDLRKTELAGPRDRGSEPSTLSRIELADLKERLKKLEAIAAGVDL